MLARPAGAVLLEAGFARAQRLELGRPVRLWTPTGIAELPVVGLLQPRGVATFNGGAVVDHASGDGATRSSRCVKQVNSVQIVLERGNATRSRRETDLQARLPAGLRVQARARAASARRDALYSIEQCLAGVSLVTLVAGAFVILNTFLINLTERRRQLAIWRALGRDARSGHRLAAARGGVARDWRGRSLGIGAGYALGLVVLGVMEQVLGGVHLPDLRWTNEALLLALLFGPGMALAATWLPARRAARRAPLEDLLARGGVHREEPRRWPAFVGLA